MSRWFRFEDDDALNNPKLLRLSDRMFRIWVGLLCVASKNGGRLPPMEDIALMLRQPPERMAEALVSLVGAGLIDRDEHGLSPHRWEERQYKSDSSAERMRRHRKKGDAEGDVTVTPYNTTHNNRTEPVTGSIEVRDEEALAAWDAYGLATNGKAYPRNRRGAWRHPSQWPPMHAIAGRTA
jgi:hypothetical protein